MRDYVIYTDSGCDVTPDILAEWGVRVKPLTFRFDGDDREYVDGAVPFREFYDRMRSGEVAKTAAVNVEAFTEAFEEVLKEGYDLLYIGFSSGLSTTYNSGRIAAEQLREKYPEAKILTEGGRHHRGGGSVRRGHKAPHLPLVHCGRPGLPQKRRTHQRGVGVLRQRAGHQARAPRGQ